MTDLSGPVGTSRSLQPWEATNNDLRKVFGFELSRAVTASILGIQIHSPGFREEGRQRRGTGRLLLQRSMSGEAEGTLCFPRLASPLIPQRR